MRFTDTHCHFETNEEAFLVPTLARAHAAGVEKLLAVGGSVELNRNALAAQEAARRHPEGSPIVLLALGYDRDQVGRDLPPLPDIGLSAVGEMGLDYHYAPETRTAQLKLFSDGLEEARRRNLPVVIHTREAEDDTLGVLREIPSRGVIHSFTGSVSAARAFLDLGFYISLSGIVTFRSAENVREVARMIPSDRLLVETDAPYLAPVPMRGRPNEPAFVVHTVAFLASLRGMPLEDFSELVCANAERLFRS